MMKTRYWTIRVEDRDDEKLDFVHETTYNVDPLLEVTALKKDVGDLKRNLCCAEKNGEIVLLNAEGALLDKERKTLEDERASLGNEISLLKNIKYLSNELVSIKEENKKLRDAAERAIEYIKIYPHDHVKRELHGDNIDMCAEILEKAMQKEQSTGQKKG